MYFNLRQGRIIFYAFFLSGIAVVLLALYFRPSSARQRWVKNYTEAYSGGLSAITKISSANRSQSTQTVSPKCQSLLDRAQSLVTPYIQYAPAYVAIPYPMGDVPAGTGVCADVIVRSLRAINIDLQEKIHLDMKNNFRTYPSLWGLWRPDPNIDHRRVPNLMMYFQRHELALATSKKPLDYEPCDIVAWDLSGGLTHIGLVSNHLDLDSTPLIIHHIGGHPSEENVLFEWKIIGHYRLKEILP